MAARIGGNLKNLQGTTALTRLALGGIALLAAQVAAAPVWAEAPPPVQSDVGQSDVGQSEAGQSEAGQSEAGRSGSGAGQPLQLAMADTGSGLETVVVTGSQWSETTKTGTPLIETPQNIQVLPADLIQVQGDVTLNEALRNVAGVMPGGYYSTYDYFRIRGFDASGYIYQDNLRYDSSVQLNAELYGLEAVEIMKGPSSALYGQGALGGLVNLVSKTPKPQAFLSAGASYGSFDSWDLHLDGGGTIASVANGDLEGRVVFVQRHDGSFVQHVDGGDRTYIAPSLTWNIDPDTSLTVLASYQHDRIQMAFPLTYIGAVVPGPFGKYPLDRYTGEPDSNRSWNERDTIGYQFRHRFNQVFSVEQNLRTAFSRTNWDHIMYTSYLGADERTLYRYPYSSSADWNDFGVDTRLKAEFATGPVAHGVVVGVDYFDYRSSWLQRQIDYGDPSAYMPLDLYAPVYGTPFSPLTNVSTAKELVRDTGLYIQDHAKFGKLTLTGSLRWDFARTGDSWSGPFTAHDDDAFVPRVGATYEVLPRTVVYASYSESFKPQSGSDYAGHPLDPETGQQWEAGIKADLIDNRLSVTASAFQLTRQNVATADPVHTGFSNVSGEQQSKGVELDAHANLADGWQAILTYAYVDAKVTKDNTLPIGDHPQNAPPTSVSLWTTYEFQDGPLKGFGIGGGVYHYSHQAGDLPNTFDLPGYTLVNAMVSYDFGPFTARFNVENLTGEDYFTGSYSDTYVQPGAPRNYMVHIDWNL